MLFRPTTITRSSGVSGACSTASSSVFLLVSLEEVFSCWHLSTLKMIVRKQRSSKVSTYLLNLSCLYASHDIDSVKLKHKCTCCGNNTIVSINKRNVKSQQGLRLNKSSLLKKTDFAEHTTVTEVQLLTPSKYEGNKIALLQVMHLHERCFLLSSGLWSPLPSPLKEVIYKVYDLQKICWIGWNAILNHLDSYSFLLLWLGFLGTRNECCLSREDELQGKICKKE